MSRVRIAAAIAAVASLAFAGVALAASATRVTGGTTQITASSAAAKVLSDNHITVKALAPASSSGSAFTFPIVGGALNVKTLHGFIRHSGGISVSSGTKTLVARQLTIVSTKRRASIDALVRTPAARVCRSVGRHHHGLRCRIVVRVAAVQLARLTKVKVSNGSATATVNITAYTAGAINRLAGKHVVSAGAVLGTAKISPTLKS